TDTVYGLCTSASGEAPSRRLYRLKQRPAGQPAALLCWDVDVLLDSVPELRGRAELIVRELLPGPFTLVLPHPGRRYPWLTGGAPASRTSTRRSPSWSVASSSASATGSS